MLVPETAFLTWHSLHWQVLQSADWSWNGAKRSFSHFPLVLMQNLNIRSEETNTTATVQLNHIQEDISWPTVWYGSQAPTVCRTITFAVQRKKHLFIVPRMIIPFKLACTSQSAVIATTQPSEHHSVDYFQVCFSSVLNMNGIALPMNVVHPYFSQGHAAIPSTVAGENAVQEEGSLCWYFSCWSRPRWLLVFRSCNCSWP